MEGKVVTRKTCRFCGSRKMFKFLDLGKMPHAGDFLIKSQIGKESYYPLRIHLCKKCGLVQILDVIPPKTLFANYRYLSSIGLREHFKKYADEISKKFLTKNSFIVEIGSNDGVLLSPLLEKGYQVLGVDPAKNVVKLASKKGIKTIKDFFNLKTAKKISERYGMADAILANNVLAHIDNMVDVFKGITKLLKPTGALIFEVHYLPDLLRKMQYDFFYNEHLSYYTLTVLSSFLKKFGLTIFDVKKIKIHSGSIRVYAKFSSNKSISLESSVKKLMESEQKDQKLKTSYFEEFARRVNAHKDKIQNVIMSIKKSGNRIVGYGAGGRANTLLNYCGIDVKLIDYIVDESPERQNRFTPGTHIPIVSPDVFRMDNVKDVLLLAWNYKKEIFIKEAKFVKSGGIFIIPFPKISKI